ncbi:TetR/AcrR family transcriptional regulator [Rhodococcus sp. IEGM 248]|nr:TetR/AcrR family transcriptional regulator [Rhodococcus sp. IEGM 248]
MQKRAEVTGAALLRAAAAVFIRAGYAHARLNTIITEAHVSKGALYDHFGSKEELARAVIAAGNTGFKSACDPFLTSGIPAVEALIGISCLLLDPAVNDTMVQATFRLITDIGDRPATGTTLLGTWLSDYQHLVRRAIAEGDLREEDPDTLAHLLVEAFTGIHLVVAATGRSDDLPTQLTSTWDLLLPCLVDATKLDHSRSLVTRQVARFGDHRTPRPPPSSPSTCDRPTNRGEPQSDRQRRTAGNPVRDPTPRRRPTKTREEPA